MEESRGLEIREDEIGFCRLAAISLMGDREEQQDAYAYRLGAAGLLAAVCDGMGGQQGGALAARLAVEVIRCLKWEENAPPELRDLLEAFRRADARIAALQDENGCLLRAGSTAVALLIRYPLLCWCSVGDSRGYLFRKGELAQFTKDQNYQTVLEEQRRAGLINEARFQKESLKGEALINYLGLGSLSLIDYNERPFPLLTGDKLLLCTDGLYRLVEEEEIRRILEEEDSPGKALAVLEMAAGKQAGQKNLKRDNMTALLIEIKEIKQ